MSRLHRASRTVALVVALAVAPLASAQNAGSHGFDGRALAAETGGGPRIRPPGVAGEILTPRFRLLYTERSEGSARALAARIEEARDAFQQIIGRDWPGTTEIRVALGREEMAQLALPGGAVPSWAEALAYPGHNIILLDANSLLKPGGDVTLRHELSHVALGQLAPAWPRWFQEGVAMYLTGDRFSLTQYTAMFRAVTNDRLIDFEDLAGAWPDKPHDVEIAYAQSVTFVAHLVDRFGPEKLGALVDEVRSGTVFEVAFARAFHTSIGAEQAAWETTLPARYSWTPIVTGGSMLWGVAALLTVAGWVRRRRVKSLRLAEMAAEEAAEEAARLVETAEDPLFDPPLSQLPRAEDEDLPAVADGEIPPRRTLH